MKAEGLDVISFGAGEPDFPTPEPICRAGKEAIDSGFTKYTPTSGLPQLKEAIAHKLEKDNGVHVRPEQVVISCGAKHSLYNSAMMLLDPGDEAIVLAPYWMTYVDQIELAGAKAAVARCLPENEFVPTADAIREAITARTKAIFLNSPTNPTGAVFPRQTLKEIAQIALQNDLWIIADEIYEKLVYGAEHTSIASLGSEVAEHTVTIGGCSKSYAMTGWRLGYAAAPLAIAKAMASFQDAVTSNPSAISQKAALAAFAMEPSSIEKMRAEFESRRDLMAEELGKIPGVRAARPKGAFYMFADFGACLGGEAKTDSELSQFLLEQALVATVPGSVFDAPGFLRLSYTASKENIKKGVARIAEALSVL